MSNSFRPTPNLTPTLLTARLLGRVSLAVGDRVITDADWPPRGGRELLLFLLATPGHRIARERLYDALWPEWPLPAARNAYYKSLHSLRRTLEPDLAAREAGSFVRSDAETVALDAELIDVDVDRHDDLLERARAAAGKEKAALLRDALAAKRYRARRRIGRLAGTGRQHRGEAQEVKEKRAAVVPLGKPASIV